MKTSEDTDKGGIRNKELESGSQQQRRMKESHNAIDLND